MVELNIEVIINQCFIDIDKQRKSNFEAFDLSEAKEYIEIFKNKVTSHENNIIIPFSDFLKIKQLEIFFNDVYELIEKPTIKDFTIFKNNYYHFKEALREKKYIKEYFELSKNYKGVFEKSSYEEFKKFILNLENKNDIKYEEFKIIVLGNIVEKNISDKNNSKFSDDF